MSTTEFRCANQRQAGQLVSIESPPGESPSEAEAGVSRERPTGAARGGRGAGQSGADPGLRLPLSQVPSLPAGPGSRPGPLAGDTSFFGQVGPRLGRGQGRKIKPQRLTT